MILATSLTGIARLNIKQVELKKKRALARQDAKVNLKKAIFELQEKMGPDGHFLWPNVKGELEVHDGHQLLETLDASIKPASREKSLGVISHNGVLKQNLVYCLEDEQSLLAENRLLQRIKNAVADRALLVNGKIKPKAVHPGQGQNPVGPIFQSFKWGFAFSKQGGHLQPYIFVQAQIVNPYDYPLNVSDYYMDIELEGELGLDFILKEEGLHLREPRKVLLSELFPNEKLQLTITESWKAGESKVLRFNAIPLNVPNGLKGVHANQYEFYLYEYSSHTNRWPYTKVYLRDTLGQQFQQLDIFSFICDIEEGSGMMVLDQEIPSVPDVAFSVSWHLLNGWPHVDHYNMRAIKATAKQSRCCWELKGGWRREGYLWGSECKSLVQPLYSFLLNYPQALADLRSIDLARKGKDASFLVGEKIKPTVIESRYVEMPKTVFYHYENDADSESESYIEMSDQRRLEDILNLDIDDDDDDE